MRLRVLLAVTFVAFGVGAPAFAQSADRESGLPDLPGMRVADRATRGEVAPSQSSKHGDTGTTDSKDEGTKTSEDGKQQKAEPPDPSSIQELPGTGGLPTIGEQRVGLAVNRGKADTMPRGLLAAAAVGTLVSVGSFLIVRRRYLG